MSVLRGLDAIRSKIDSRQSFNNVNDRELTQNIESGKSKTIRFVQELDESAKGYSEDYGLGIVVSEFEHPDHFWLKLVDTSEDEGACWAAEQGWKNKITLYINVVDVDTGEVYYLARSVLGGLGEQVVESAGERGSLTDSVWRIKKTGEGMGTRYKLNLIEISDEPLDVDPDDLVDFEKDVLNEVPHDEQEAFVRQIEQRVKDKQGSTASSDSDDSDDDVW